MIKIKNKCLARAVNVQLNNYGINKYFNENNYEEEEIKKITNIILINPNSIDEIDKLVNLEVLNIGYSNCLDNENYITDFNILSKLNYLKSFTLLNNILIKKLDLSTLKNLERLKLIYNPNLKEIKLEGLTNLLDVILVGNDIKELKDFTTIMNNINVNILLDILMYPNIKKYLKDNSNIKFAEKISFGEIYKTDILTMNKVHNKALKIIDIEANNNKEESIINLYRYIVTNLTYDYDGLEERNNYYINNRYNPFLEDEKINRFRLMNTCIQALLNGLCVCEAYVNALIYLYSLIGIKAKSLRVKIKDSNTHYDHAAMCFLLNDTIYYSDPQKEDNFIKLNKLFMTEEEFNEIYLISPLDKLIVDNWKEEINDKINKCFEKSR